MKRQAKQPAFTFRIGISYVQKSRRGCCWRVQINDFDVSALFEHEQMLCIARSKRRKQRTRQPRGYSRGRARECRMYGLNMQ